MDVQEAGPCKSARSTPCRKGVDERREVKRWDDKELAVEQPQPDGAQGKPGSLSEPGRLQTARVRVRAQKNKRWLVPKAPPLLCKTHDNVGMVPRAGCWNEVDRSR